MRSRAGAVAVLALAAGLTGATPAPDRFSVVTDCADPALPAELLPVAPAPAVSPLPVVEARAGAVRLRLAVAADPDSRESGLMCVTALRPRRGMIFVFPEAGPQPFWMKRTLIALDMIWLDAAGTVTSVAADVPASKLETADRDVARRTGTGTFVVEVAAGEARRDGIETGERVVLPPLRATR